MDNLNTLYTTISDKGPIPETLDGGSYVAYLHPEDAIHRGGLWRCGTANRLLRLEPIGDVIHEHSEPDSPIHAEGGFNVLGLASIDGPLYTLSRAFGEHTEDMYTEQTAWRRALRRPLNDPESVVALLEKTLEWRELSLWKIERVGSLEELEARRNMEGMYSWSLLYAQSAFETWRDRSLDDEGLEQALRVGWSTWFSSYYWDDLDYAADPDPNDSIDWVIWDAWAALTLFFAGKSELVSFQPNILSEHYRTAYRYGLKLAAPIAPGVLGYCL